MTEGPEGHLYCQKYTKYTEYTTQIKQRKKDKQTNTNNGAVQEYKKQTIIKPGTETVAVLFNFCRDVGHFLTLPLPSSNLVVLHW